MFPNTREWMKLSHPQMDTIICFLLFIFGYVEQKKIISLNFDYWIVYVGRTPPASTRCFSYKDFTHYFLISICIISSMILAYDEFLCKQRDWFSRKICSQFCVIYLCCSFTYLLYQFNRNKDYSAECLVSSSCGYCSKYRIFGMEEKIEIGNWKILCYSYTSFPCQVLEEEIHTRKAF